jgi:hypothetical protein
LMELPAAKTVPPLLLLTALDGASDLGCLPLLLLSKRLGQAGGQSEAFRERFSLGRINIHNCTIIYNRDLFELIHDCSMS